MFNKNTVKGPRGIKKLFGKPVAVLWEDAASNSGWFSKEDVKGIAENQHPMLTYGLLHHDTSDKRLVLVQTHPPGEFTPSGSVWTIPWGMVIRVKELK